MSSFFTLPASQRKRKREGHTSRGEQSRSSARRKTNDDESISGSDSDDDRIATDGVDDDLSDDSDEGEHRNEDPAAKRVRLAEQYLANTQREIAQDVGFDAAEIDKENLRRRMGDRLKEDTAEERGKIYKFIAEEHNWTEATCSQFRNHTDALTGIAHGAGFVYTVAKDRNLIKWMLPGDGAAGSRKPRRVKIARSERGDPKRHQDDILCVAASADGKFVATGGADNRLIIWSAETMEPLKVFSGQLRDNGHRDSVLAVAFRKGSNQLFSAGKDRTVKIWSCDELAYVETLFGHQDEVLDIDALGREICVSVGARDRSARYWRVVEETQLVFRGGGAAGRGQKMTNGDAGTHGDLGGHEGSIDRIAFVDDDTFVTGSDNGALTLWNIHKKKAVFSLPLAHGLQPPPSLDERSADPNPEYQYQDTEALLELRPQPRWITALRVVPFSDLIVTGSWDGHLRAFKITPDRRRIEAVSALGDSSVSVPGCVNDLAIIERGDRGRGGLMIAAAVGREHRLGAWQHGGKNAAYLFEVARFVRTNGVHDKEQPKQIAERETAFGGFD